jgi:hypothetical protein
MRLAPRCQEWQSGRWYNPTSGPLAQLVEQGTFNPKVVGSIPTRPTTSFPAWRANLVPLIGSREAPEVPSCQRIVNAVSEPLRHDQRGDCGRGLFIVSRHRVRVEIQRDACVRVAESLGDNTDWLLAFDEGNGREGMAQAVE